MVHRALPDIGSAPHRLRQMTYVSSLLIMAEDALRNPIAQGALRRSVVRSAAVERCRIGRAVNVDCRKYSARIA
jgi:hypothetical protein